MEEIKTKILIQLRKMWKDIDDWEKSNKKDELMNPHFLAGKKEAIEEMAEVVKELEE